MLYENRNKLLFKKYLLSCLLFFVFWLNRNFCVEGSMVGEVMKNFLELRKELIIIFNYM